MSKKISDKEIVEYLRSGKRSYDDITEDLGIHRTTAFRRIENISSAGYDVRVDKEGNKKLFTIKGEQSAPGLKEAMTTNDKRAATDKQRNMYNEMVDALDDIYEELDDFEKEPVEVPEEGETAILYVGDIHYGAVVEEDGDVIYDSEKAKEKIQQLEKNTRKMTDFIKEQKDIEEFDFAFLGDIIENDIIYENQKYEIDKKPLDQVREATEEFIPLIKNYADEFEQVRIYTVRGNHGRMSEGSHDASNWDNVFYNMLKLGLKGEENVHVDVGEGAWNEFEVYNKDIGITHGDNLHYQAGTSAGEKKYLRQFASKDLDEIHQGHYHSRKSDEVLGKTIYWNGSTKPAGEYEEDLGVDAVQTQTLMTYSPDRGTTGVYFIDLRDDEADIDEQL